MVAQLLFARIDCSEFENRTGFTLAGLRPGWAVRQRRLAALVVCTSYSAYIHVALRRELLSKHQSSTTILLRSMRSALARTSLLGLARSMATTPTKRVAAMEVMLAMNPADAARYGRDGGFAHAGSSAGRHVEKLYEAGRLQGSLARATTALFDGKVKHAMVVSGFYVLHDSGGPGTTGSCGTDGPPGALAIVRALCARGIQTSLYCDAHNGPVLRAGFEAMVVYYEGKRPDIATRLRSHCRCVDVDDRSDHLAALKASIAKAWGPVEVDALVAIERLSEPYRNIRGLDLSDHKEPIDVLWPHVNGDSCSNARRLAGIKEDAVSIGIGDGGNEVGLGAIAQLEAVKELSPGADSCALEVNGALRRCDCPVVATVSNWGGSALEAAAHVLFPVELDDLEAGVERRVLEAICAAGSVDGKYVELPLSVDGMAWEPVHREFYEALWAVRPDH